MPHLSHENLTVYQRSITFVVWAHNFSETRKLTGQLASQFERALTSIPLNIAEGNGKFTKRDQAKFYDIAKGSSLECGACLDVAVAKKIATGTEVEDGKRLLVEIVSMLAGLIKATAPDRVREERPVYSLSPSPPQPSP